MKKSEAYTSVAALALCGVVSVVANLPGFRDTGRQLVAMTAQAVTPDVPLKDDPKLLTFIHDVGEAMRADVKTGVIENPYCMGQVFKIAQNDITVSCRWDSIMLPERAEARIIVNGETQNRQYYAAFYAPGIHGPKID